MFAVMPVNAVPPRRPAWKRPEYGPPAESQEKPESHTAPYLSSGALDELPVIDLEPLQLDEDMELPALLTRGAEFPTGLILDIRA